MSSRALTPFTAKPAFSSAGVSRTNSIGRCDPVPFDRADADESTVADCWIRFPVCDRAEGIQAFLDVCVPSDNGTLSLSEADACRLLCHALVQHLPAAAFGEAVEVLTGMYEFYRTLPALPALPSYRPFKAKVTGAYTVPTFPVLEE